MNLMDVIISHHNIQDDFNLHLPITYKGQLGDLGVMCIQFLTQERV